MIKHPLERYTDGVWLFPFGAGPDLRAPVQVFRNGLSAWMGEEVRLFTIGSKTPTVVAVLDPPAQEGDVVQATYVTARMGA